jgi:dTDP-rhamnose C3-O-methyltransferase
MSNFDGFKKTGIDADIEARLAAHMSKYAISPLEALKLFPVLSRRQMLKRFLAHTELFKMTLGLPGDIAEIGVFRGLGLMTWANLLEAYCIGARTKTVYGFDNWQGFTAFSQEDGIEIATAGKTLGGFDPSQYRLELLDAIRIFDADRFIPWKERVKLIDGKAEATIPNFAKENPGVRFSLVHFDCDLYEPTKIALETLWPLVVRGGVVIFDEYGIPDWPGETKAVDEYFADLPDVRLRTFDWTNAPAAYVVKR